MIKLIHQTSVRRNIRRMFVATSCCLLLGWIMPGETSAATQESNGIIRVTLNNGLRVVIVRNTLAPVVATAISYLVGADFENASLYKADFRGAKGLTIEQLANKYKVCQDSIYRHLNTVKPVANG